LHFQKSFSIFVIQHVQHARVGYNAVKGGDVRPFRQWLSHKKIALLRISTDGGFNLLTHVLIVSSPRLAIYALLNMLLYIILLLLISAT